ncbi:MAG TPA: DUF4402 domain-containing protein [Cellvibrio sp.]
MSKKSWLTLLLVVLPSCAKADFTIDAPLNFGEIAVRSNDSVSTVTVYRNGAYLSTNHIFIITPGSPGVFTVSNIAPYSNVNITADVPASSSSPYPNTAQFTLTAVDLPSAINTGASGSAQFKMGGTLSTSGNPAKNYYSGANYLIYVTINLSY